MIVNKPAVFIYTVRPDPDILREIRAGMEEEGVFCEVTPQADAAADVLAWHAAEDSMPGCGIGLCENDVALQLKGLPMGRNVESYSYPTKEQSRTLGANAARAIKKQALR